MAFSALASGVGASLVKQGFKAVAKDRNILIPLDDPSETQIITDKQLKAQVCPIQAKQSSNRKTKTKTKRKTKKPRKTKLEKVLERMA